MKNLLQRIIQILFLGLFIFLIFNGKVQMWMRVFLLGILVSIILGRIYCGWICPINTGMNIITWIKRKFKIKSFDTPNFIKKSWVRYSFLGIFILLFIFINKTGKQLPVLPGLFLLGIIVTLFFKEELWHSYICPYGTIFSITSRISPLSMKINPEACTNCGICKKVCPSTAVEVEENQHKIIKKECLICMECSRNCPTDTIDYGKTSKSQKAK